MSRNTKTHPNNKYIVNAQLDERSYYYFTEIRQVLDLNTTDALKAIIDETICRYIRALGNARKDAASEAVFNDNAKEKRRIFEKIMNEEKAAQS